MQSGIYYAAQTDSLGCVWYSDTLNIDVGRKRNNIRIVTNPIKENLLLRIPQSWTVKQVVVYSLLGEKVMERLRHYDKNSSAEIISCEDVPTTEYSIPLAHLQNGTYILNLLTDVGEFYFKVMKTE